MGPAAAGAQIKGEEGENGGPRKSGETVFSVDFYLALRCWMQIAAARKK